jgi:ADP-ribose pyrophosphatase YjhB (NUDIX family)
MYQVFINQSSITFQQFEKNQEFKNNRIYIRFSCLEELVPSVGLLKSNTNPLHIVYLVDNVELVWQSFQQQFEMVEAAGGVVYNPKNELLFILRFGKWDLPKGKVEAGEQIDEAAVREVEEECGLKDIVLEEQLMTTYHVYWLKERQILKPTYWFKMRVINDQNLTPQTEEGIEMVEWIKSTSLEAVKENTYASIEALLKSIPTSLS